MIWVQNLMFSFIIVICKHVCIFFVITYYNDVLLLWFAVLFFNIKNLVTLFKTIAMVMITKKIHISK